MSAIIEILLAIAFHVIINCLVVTNNSCHTSSSSTFFIFNLNIAPFLFFAADFDLFRCVFVTLTLSLSLFDSSSFL